MELQTQIKFAELYSKFYNEEHTPPDIAGLIETIRYNKFLISDTAKQLLLQIPLCVLEDQVEIKNSAAWAKKMENTLLEIMQRSLYTLVLNQKTLI